MILMLIYAAVYVVVIVCFGVALSQVKGFLAGTSSISDEQALERFKALARTNMRMALVQIPVFGVGLIVGVVLIVQHGLPAFGAVLLVNLAVVPLGMYLSKFEKQTRALPAATEDLAQRYRQVSESWVKKPLPDF